MLGWFRRFRLPPPPLVLSRVRRPPLFFSLALSRVCPLRVQGLPAPGQVCRVGVLSAPLLLRSPLRVLVK